MEKTKAEDWYEQGYKHFQQSEYDYAILRFEKCLQLDPDFLPALKILGSIYNGDYDDNSNSGTYDVNYFSDIGKAAKYFSKAIQVDPKDCQGYLRLSRIYQNSEKGVQYLLKYLQLKPKDQNAIYSLGLAYYQINNKQQAAKVFKQCIQMNRKDPRPYHQLGVIYEEWGRLQEAVKFVKKRIELYNGDCEDYTHLGRLYDKMGKIDGAVSQYQHCVYLRKNHQQANKYLNKHGRKNIHH